MCDLYHAQDDPYPDPAALVAPDASPPQVEDPFDEDFVDPEEAAAAAAGQTRSAAEVERSIQEKQVCYVSHILDASRLQNWCVDCLTLLSSRTLER